MICATSQSASAPSNQFTIRWTNMYGLQPEIMISHGDALRRNLRLRISGVETGLLSGQDSGQPVSEALRCTAELRGNPLHVPAPAFGLHAGELGGADTRWVRLRGEGQHADHAHPAIEERR